MGVRGVHLRATVPRFATRFETQWGWPHEFRRPAIMRYVSGSTNARGGRTLLQDVWFGGTPAPIGSWGSA